MTENKNQLTELDIRIILDEKPYGLETAIEYANRLAIKYRHYYCVVKEIKERFEKYKIVGFHYFREHIPDFKLFHIAVYKQRKCRK